MSKTIYCGECEKFAYEDTDGYGFCLKTNMKCRCSDKCRLVPKKNFATLTSAATSNAQSGKNVRDTPHTSRTDGCLTTS